MRYTNMLLLVALLAPATIQAQMRSSAAAIEIIGGPHAGKYTLTTKDAGCLIAEKRAPKQFSVTSAIPPSDARSKDPKSLTYIQVNIRKVTASAPPPSDFLVTVTFGPVMDHANETVYMSGSNTTTGQKGGTGTVMLKDNGTEPTVSLELQPQAGVVIKGTITCTNPLRY